MYAWMHTSPTQETMAEWMKRELNQDWMGVGLYLTDTDTMLVTVEDKHGERATDIPPSRPPCKDSRYCLYVFNAPFEKTVMALTPRTAADDRS